MYTDEILKEIWQNRETYAQQHQHNLQRMLDDLKARQEKSTHLFVDRRKSIQRKS